MWDYTEDPFDIDEEEYPDANPNSDICKLIALDTQRGVSAAAEAFTAAMSDSVKNTIRSLHEEIERLKDANSRLRQQNNADRLKLDNMVREEKAFQDKVRRCRVKELIAPFQRTLWNVEVVSAYVKKCDKCDSKRLIHFKSPSGREYTESCSCNKHIARYKPRKWDGFSAVCLADEEYGREGQYAYALVEHKGYNTTYREKDIVTIYDADASEDIRYNKLIANEELAKAYAELFTEQNRGAEDLEDYRYDIFGNEYVFQKADMDKVTTIADIIGDDPEYDVFNVDDDEVPFA